MNQKVSIITPMYNAQQYIGETIASVQAQTYEDWEMIVVDDCSTDTSVSLVESYACQDERIRLIKNQINQGVAVTRNTGIGAATGRYLAFLDSDDLWKPGKLQQQIDFMKQTGADFSYTACEVIDGKGNPAGPERSVPAQENYGQLLRGNGIPCLTVMADLESIPKELMCMPAISHEDYATWLRIARMGYSMKGLNHVLASYRNQANSLSGNKIQAAKWQWNIYRRQEGLSVIKSLYYMCFYMYQALKKRIG